MGQSNNGYLDDVDIPVDIYIENVNQAETSYCRLDGLTDLFNIISYESCC